MKTRIMSLDNWPRLNNGGYMFQNTEEAFFFANLALDKPAVISNLKRSMVLARVAIHNERTRSVPNLQRMLDLAVKSQFFRECLEEIHRIKKEVY